MFSASRLAHQLGCILTSECLHAYLCTDCTLPEYFNLPLLNTSQTSACPLHPMQFLELKSDAILMALGIGDTAGLDRETRDLYTVIVRGFSGPLGLEAYTSVS